MEITKKNFEDEFHNITENLKRACFVGFDAEFTAILTGESFKYRLFDTSEERYNKMKTEVGNMIMTQIGLSMFQYDRTSYEYTAVSYTFYLCPQVFGDIDQSFIFQASTLKFLCKHNFDFNKFTYEGLPYLSRAEEAKVKKSISDKSLFNNVHRSLGREEEQELQQYCSEVSRWLTTSDEETMYIDVSEPVLRYIIHNELRIRFPDILTTDSLGNSKKILIYRDENVEGAISTPVITLEENVMTHLLGFTNIISLLEKYQKPIVGHNMCLDLILLHNQFIGPLPQKYTTFKKNINSVFPIIYDTKYISHLVGKTMTYSEIWKSNALQDLYEYFKDKKDKKRQQGVNIVKLSKPFHKEQTYHEAGWDAYCAAYIFLRLGHWVACENRGFYRTVEPVEKIAVLSPYCNKINIIRGAVPYMNLVGDDPPTHRPNLIHVKSLKESAINIEKIASKLASFGSVDVKPFGARSALVATNSLFTMTAVLKHFQTSKEYKVSKYNSFRHYVAGPVTMWGGVLITGSLVLYLLHKKIKSSSC